MLQCMGWVCGLCDCRDNIDCTLTTIDIAANQLTGPTQECCISDLCSTGILQTLSIYCRPSISCSHTAFHQRVNDADSVSGNLLDLWRYYANEGDQ